MKPTNLQSIKQESIRKVFYAIAESKTISRAELAEKTGLSLMTIGKIAQLLCDAEVTRQKKESRATAGRRASALSMNRDNCAVVLDLTSRNFTLLIMDVCCQTVLKLSHKYNGDFFFAENLALFLQDAAEIVFDCPASRNYIGVCVLVPGWYHEDTDFVTGSTLPEMETLPVLATVQKVFFTLPVQIVPSFHASAVSCVSSMIEDPQSKMILYWYLSDSFSYGVIFYQNQILQGAQNTHFPFWNIMLSQGRTLSSVLRGNISLEEKSLELAKILNNLLCTLNPHEVIMDCSFPVNCSLITDEIRNIFVRNYAISPSFLPPVRCVNRADPPHSHLGAVMILRDHWLENTILSE